MDITEAPETYRYIKQLKIAQCLADQFSEAMPDLTPEKIAALVTLVLASDYHGDYLPNEDMYLAGKAVMDYEPKGFAKSVSPIEAVYSFVTCQLVKLPYVFKWDGTTEQYYLSEQEYV